MGKNVSVLEQIGFRPTNSNELWLTTEVFHCNLNLTRNISVNKDSSAQRRGIYNSSFSHRLQDIEKQSDGASRDFHCNQNMCINLKNIYAYTQTTT